MKNRYWWIVILICWWQINAPVVGAMTEAPVGEECGLKSADGTVEVVLDKKYGGAITKIVDKQNGGLNMVNNSQAGAMFQTAFWLSRRYESLPPKCNNTPDMWYENPTQAGFWGDGWKGNPIGKMGLTDQVDSAEYFLCDSGNPTNPNLRLKTRMIRYNYCYNGDPIFSDPGCDAAARNFLNNPNATCKDIWDTNFYLEQTISFHPTLKRTLVINSKISYVGSNDVPAKDRTISSRQLPVFFAQGLSRGVYRKDGDRVFLDKPGNNDFDPDRNWEAMLWPNKDFGVGYVTTNKMDSMLRGYPGGQNRRKMSISIDDPSQSEARGGVMGTDGVIDFRQIGTVNDKVSFPGGEATEFLNGGESSWSMYFPVGSLDYIEKAATALLSYPSGKTFSEDVDGYIDRVSCSQVVGWARNSVTHEAVDRVRAEIYPMGEYENKIERVTTSFTSRSDLKQANICDKCVFDLNLAELPTGFKDKKLQIEIWGEMAQGEGVLTNNKTMVGPCTNLINAWLKGDANHDGKINLGDFIVWKREFLTSSGLMSDFNADGKISFADFGIWKSEFLKSL